MTTSPLLRTCLIVLAAFAPFSPSFAQIPAPALDPGELALLKADHLTAAFQAQLAGDKEGAILELRQALRLDPDDPVIRKFYENLGGGRPEPSAGANALAQEIAPNHGMSSTVITNTIEEPLILPPDLPELPPVPALPPPDFSNGGSKPGGSTTPELPVFPQLPSLPQPVGSAEGQMEVEPNATLIAPPAPSPILPLILPELPPIGEGFSPLPPAVAPPPSAFASQKPIPEQIHEVLTQVALLDEQIAIEEVRNDIVKVNELNVQRAVLTERLKRLQEMEAAQAAALEKEKSAYGSNASTLPKHIKVGETIELMVLEDETFSGMYEVRLGGYILIPRVGRAYVDGKTVPEAEKSISDALKNMVLDATVFVERPNADKEDEKEGGIIFLTGEFLKPGPFNIIKGRVPTLASSFIRAGGETHKADLAKVRVMRLVNGRNQIEIVDLNEIINGNELGNDMVLRDGDIVQIPARKRLSVFEQTQSDVPGLENLRGYTQGGGGRRGDLLSGEGVYVTGRVKRPGFIFMADDDDEDLTAYQAIIAADGFAPFADIRKIFVMRDNGGGHKINLPLDLKHVWLGLEPDIVLKRTDIVVVPEKFWSF